MQPLTTSSMVKDLTKSHITVTKENHEQMRNSIININTITPTKLLHQQLHEEVRPKNSMLTLASVNLSVCF